MQNRKKTLAEFFWARVEKREHGCWLFQGRIAGRGYGTIKIGLGGREILAHRASWEIHNGAIPSGLVVCHKCDVPACVRPDHLFVGTQSDNIRDAISKKRFTHAGKYLPNRAAITHCPAGHAYDEKNTHHSNTKGKKARHCRACARMAAARRRLSQRAANP